MVVHFKLILLTILSLSLYANENEQNEVLAIADSSYEITKRNYEAKIDECNINLSALDVNDFKHINMSSKKYESALLYLSLRASQECTKVERALYLVESSKYILIAKKYGLSLKYRNIHSADEVLDSSISDYEMEYKFYNEIDINTISKLLKVKGINKPFDAFKTLDILKKKQNLTTLE